MEVHKDSVTTASYDRCLKNQGDKAITKKHPRCFWLVRYFFKTVLGEAALTNRL